LIAVLSLALVLGASAPTESPAESPAPRSLFERNVDLSQAPAGEIRDHLTEVLSELRARPTDALAAGLAAERTRNLDVLAEYIRAGVFPRNRTFPGMRPIFIDESGSACAVGYLMQRSGAEELAARISARENFAYLHDIATPGAAEWIARSGLTAEECAMIQPAYPCFIFESLTCTSAGEDVLLVWEAGGFGFDWIHVSRDGEIIASFAPTGGETQYLDAGVPYGTHEYTVTGESAFFCIDWATCSIEHTAAEIFRRGDGNGDGVVEALPDAISILLYAFAGGAPPPCLAAADVDGNGAFEPIPEVLHLLMYAFGGGPAPAAPFPECGHDPAPDLGVGCGAAPACP
jgi:hypothetical protein